MAYAKPNNPAQDVSLHFLRVPLFKKTPLLVIGMYEVDENSRPHETTRIQDFRLSNTSKTIESSKNEGIYFKQKRTLGLGLGLLILGLGILEALMGETSTSALLDSRVQGLRA